MSDETITARIENLVAEEHELRNREEADANDVDSLEADQARLRGLEVELDRCWDLLRQRRHLLLLDDDQGFRAIFFRPEARHAESNKTT